MGEFKTPPRGRLHCLRVEVDGAVREVVSNVSLEDMRRLGLGAKWSERLAREYGRPVQVEDVAS